MAWTEQDDFIAFSFGDFNTENYNNGSKSFIRTSDGDRYNQHLTPQLKDKTAEVPGSDGQYYFGTDYGPKVFDISFAFYGLTKAEIQGIKKHFSGKEIKELRFAEESDRCYMAKVTSQPQIKALAFGDGDNEIYNGEGSVQFTAYWPYAKSATVSKTINFTVQTGEGKDSNTAITTTLCGTNALSNQGDIPTWFEFSSTNDVNISKIELYSSGQGGEEFGTVCCTIEGTNITYWSSKTGIVKSGDNIITYTGDGLFKVDVNKSHSIKIYHKNNTNSTFTFQYNHWYY